MNLRSGRLKTEMTDEAAEYTSSLEFDKIIFEADIKTNFAHTLMLKEENIIDDEIADNILGALDQLKEDGYNELVFDPSVEDIHMAIENYVTDKIGPTAGFMHTAKSRNDQVATDVRLVLRDKITETQIGILEFMEGLVEKAGEHLETVFIGYTHLQHAQPITIAHHLMAHVQALKRDYERLEDTYKRVNLNPLGSAAMTTTSFPINRQLTTDLLGFDAYLENSMDGVSSRDFISETVFDLSALCTTLSKICEELILWSTYEFGIIEMADEYSSTSSIMPQKKNPDVAELIRGKAGRVYGHLMGLLTTMKGIPLAYNKDMQEDKELTFDAIDTVKGCLALFTGMISTMQFNKQNMEASAKNGFTNATDAADYLVNHGVPFRDAHGIVGRLVLTCIDKGISLDELPLEEYKAISPVFENDIYEAISMKTCVEKRMTIGAPGPDVMEKVIAENKKYLEENIALKKSKEDIPVTGMAVLRQQYTLAEAIEEWIASLKKEINS